MEGCENLMKSSSSHKRIIIMAAHRDRRKFVSVYINTYLNKFCFFCKTDTRKKEGGRRKIIQNITFSGSPISRGATVSPWSRKREVKRALLIPHQKWRRENGGRRKSLIWKGRKKRGKGSGEVERGRRAEGRGRGGGGRGGKQGYHIQRSEKLRKRKRGKSAGTERFFEGKGEEGLCAGIETRGEIGQLKRGNYCKVF